MLKDIFAPLGYFPGHELELIPSGEPYFDRLLRIINEARQLIHFQVYIFDEDDTGKEVAAALIKARERGVEVFLTVDSYGSKDLSPGFIAALMAHGIHFRFFSPLPKHFYAFRVGRRMHNKVVVADNQEALVGGINIADKYRGRATEAPWLDYAIRVKGPVCLELTQRCARIFQEKFFGKLKGQRVVVMPPQSGQMRCRVALNDWFRRKNQVSAGYRTAFRRAQHSITIMASYFLPSRSLRTILKKAVERGVTVSLLLPGKSDVPMAKRATRYLYHWLLRNNIRIYEWDHSILHGKLAVVDNKWTTIGSYNLNHLSKFSSIEMNVEVLDDGFSTLVSAEISSLMERSIPVSVDSMAYSVGAWSKFLDWCSYRLSRWLMLLVFYVIQREYQYREKV